MTGSAREPAEGEREELARIIAREREHFDVGEVAITVQVGDLSEHGSDKLGATFGPPDSKEALIVIDPRAFKSPAGIDHIVRHELVHVAHGTRFGDDREAAFEWLCDELARVVHENHELYRRVERGEGAPAE